MRREERQGQKQDKQPFFYRRLRALRVPSRETRLHTPEQQKFSWEPVDDRFLVRY